MRIEVVADDPPGSVNVGANELIEVLQEVLLRAGFTQHRFEDAAGRNMQITEQADSAVAFVLEFQTYRTPRLHGNVRGDSLQRLDARLFINADRVQAARLVLLDGFTIRMADELDLPGELLWVSGLGIQPILDAMRTQIGLILKNARLVGMKCFQQSLVSPPLRQLRGTTSVR